MPNYLKLSFVFIGTVIGAGFTSGQEVYSFFAQYGEKSFLGTVIAGFLFFLVFASVMYQVYIGKHLKSNSILNFIALLFMLATFFVMTSGCAVLFKEQFNMPKSLGAFAIAGISFFILASDKNGIVKLNSILTPIMIAGIIFVGIWGFHISPKLPLELQKTDYSFIFSSVVYVSYNTLTLMAVTSALKHLIKDGKTILLSSLVTAFFLGVMLIILWWLIVSFDFENSQLPVLKIASEFSGIFKMMYPPILYMSMLTTAVSNVGGAIHQLTKEKEKKFILTFIICSIAMLTYNIPFSFLVSKLYFMFGIAGIITMTVVFYNTSLSIKIVKIRKKTRKTKNKGYFFKYL